MVDIDCAALMRSYARYILIIFNLFFVLTGVIIVSVGVSAKAYFNEFDELLDAKYFYVSDLFIVVGIIVFLIAFFGCCGAAKENACMTSTFSTLLIIVFVLEAIAGITGIVLRHKSEDFLETALQKSMALYGRNDSQEITSTWDAVQSQLHCCGITNSTDWFNNSTYANHTLPLSCCQIPSGTVDHFTCNVQNAYPEGCLMVFGDYVRGNIGSIEVAGLTLAAVQLLGIIFSCYLAKQIRSDYETV
ncbi:23 kDa integral membrane protein-like [Anthonomus grandis grandis]|uniref:23 kDa integral membrane protein-like n=1 Tax=Anthonomus grandis grandis TaxID=2921223 RepID=UPI002165E25D|nr:23 kDa integral membrane protein-like [Anthonomus grandis grandis]XP_050304862.1 23 kDa integral membrane protein-like [Anthonomus grandis grandis]